MCGTADTIVLLNMVRQVRFGSPLDQSRVLIAPLLSSLTKPCDDEPLPSLPAHD